MKLTLHLTAAAWIASNMLMWWAKTRNLHPPLIKSSMYSQTASDLARALSL